MEKRPNEYLPIFSPIIAQYLTSKNAKKPLKINGFFGNIQAQAKMNVMNNMHIF